VVRIWSIHLQLFILKLIFLGKAPLVVVVLSQCCFFVCSIFRFTDFINIATYVVIIDDGRGGGSRGWWAKGGRVEEGRRTVLGSHESSSRRTQATADLGGRIDEWHTCLPVPFIAGAKRCVPPYPARPSWRVAVHPAGGWGGSQISKRWWEKGVSWSRRPTDSMEWS
jgi:hypothetical protein